MSDLSGAVASRIALLLMLVGVGVWARRSGRLDAGSVGGLSRLVIDFAYPALVFTRLLTSVDAAALAAEWPVPVAAAVSLAAGWWGARRLLGEVSAAWLAGLPNWIFLPLLIAEAVHGAAGVRTVLLFNIGAELCLWTLGIGMLIGAQPVPASPAQEAPARPGPATLTPAQLARALARNFGLWAALLGTVGALAWPELAATAAQPRAAAGAWAPAGLVLEGLTLLGTLAVPASLVVTGGLLGELSLAAVLRPSRRLLKVLALRLAVAPALGWGLLLGLEALGWALPPTARFMLLVTLAMPVAISGPVYLRRFGGDAALGSQAVVWSTALSLATVPVWVALFGS